MKSRTELPLRGLNGSNPLGFLAALGILKVLSEWFPQRDFRLHWKQEAHYIAVLSANRLPLNFMAVSRYLAVRLRKLPSPNSDEHLPRNLNKWTNAQFRQFALNAASKAKEGDQRLAQFAAAFSVDGLVLPEEEIEDSALRTVSGSGRQDLFPTLEGLRTQTMDSHLRRTLFASWDYADERLSLRYDPIEDRRHALRWTKPADEPSRTMWGANRLAVEAWVLFPTAPVSGQLRTTGFTKNLFNWPIWETPLSLDTIRSLLALEHLQAREISRESLQERGITEVFRSERITVDKFRNFTPSFSP
jgi:hypothetical protein